METRDTGRLILDEERFSLTVECLAQTLMEAFDAFADVAVVAIQPRGVLLARRLVDRIAKEPGMQAPLLGTLDTTFYRDDFRRRDKPLEAHDTEMPFLVEGRQVVLVDDVLYTGRTVLAALTALNHFGRPAGVSLLVLVNRRFNRHVPIQPAFSGIQVDALDQAYVRVEWAEEGGVDRVWLYPDKKSYKS